MKDHVAIIEELDVATRLADSVSSYLKSKGISGPAIAHCRDLVNACNQSGPKAAIFMEKVARYLDDMALLIAGTESTWEGCPEIIESMFGKRRFTDPDNRLVQNGVNLLEMTLYCLTQEQLSAKICPALETILLSGFRLWFDSQFPENQAHRRNLFFKKSKKVKSL